MRTCTVDATVDRVSMACIISIFVCFLSFVLSNSVISPLIFVLKSWNSYTALPISERFFNIFHSRMLRFCSVDFFGSPQSQRKAGRSYITVRIPRKRLALKTGLVCSPLSKSTVSTSISIPSGMHCLTGIVFPSKNIFFVNTQDRPAWQLQSPPYNKQSKSC